MIEDEPKYESKEACDGFPQDIEHHVFDRRTSRERKFRARHQTRIRDILGHINNMRLMQKLFLSCEGEATASVFDELALINKAIEMLSSALVMLSHGSTLEALILLRTALETGCAALLIHRDERERAKYYQASGKPFQSQKAIGKAKREIGCIGRLYGILSTVGVHVDMQMHGPKVLRVKEDGAISLSIGPYDASMSEEEEAVILHLVFLITFILERLLELVSIEQRGNMLSAGVKRFQYISCSHKAIERLYGEFLEMLGASA